MNDALSRIPKISLVIPTMGDIDSIKRCLHSLITARQLKFLETAEIVIFYNEKYQRNEHLNLIRKELGYLQNHIPKVKFVQASNFLLTSEESAFAAAEYASGEYLWIIGDQRTLLPEALEKLDEWLLHSDADCAYFNGIWSNRDGKQTASVSTHTNGVQVRLKYKDFVLRNGHNFMPTAFGHWIFKRSYLDMKIWKQIIEDCGPHFSHVTALLTSISELSIDVFAIPISQNEEKDYHQGDASEWEDYSIRAGVYRYYPWTLGLVRQFEYLLNANVYTLSEFKRAMCVERRLIKRQINEVTTFTYEQIKFGLYNPKQRFSAGEADQLFDFILLIDPKQQRLVSNLRKIYSSGDRMGRRELKDAYKRIEAAISQDQGEIPFITLVLGQVDNRLIRLHPSGYLVSKIEDRDQFQKAYQFTDPPFETDEWSIVQKLEFLQDASQNATLRGSTYVPELDTRLLGQLKTKRSKRVVEFLYNFKVTYRLVAMLSPEFKRKLRKALT